MTTFLVAFVVFAWVTAAMSIGAIASGRRLRGSCGGTGADCACHEARQTPHAG